MKRVSFSVPLFAYMLTVLDDIELAVIRGATQNTELLMYTNDVIKKEIASRRTTRVRQQTSQLCYTIY
jgi:hypothetical protein